MDPALQTLGLEDERLRRIIAKETPEIEVKTEFLVYSYRAEYKMSVINQYQDHAL
ncbi:MAG: hypothetical protein IH591_01520 [Bacteroidales bacterium]|nr:hypothetical protein [Bacteroidales bacterium]